MNQLLRRDGPTRRGLLLGGGAAAGLLGLGLRPARAQDLFPLTTAFGWISNVEYAGFWTALERGFFAEEGIDAAYVSGGPNAPDVLVSLAADSAQIGLANWLPILDAAAQDNDFVILGAQWARSPAAMLSLAARPLRTPEDLVGSRILAQNESDRVIVDAILAGAGLPLDYEIVPTGFSPEPLLAGDGDFYFAFATNQPITLESLGLVQGQDFFVTLFDDLGYQVIQGLIVAKRSTVAADRERVVAYFRALIRGWEYALANPGYAPEIVISKYGAELGLDPAQQARQMELQVPLITPPDGGLLLGFDPAIVEGPMTAAAQAAGRTVPPLDRIVDLSLLQEAHASL